MKYLKKCWKKVIATSLLLSLSLSLTACGESGGTSATGAAADGSKELNVIAWSSMYTDAQCQAIEKATGIKLNVTPFNSLEELYTKLNSGGVDYDMCVSGDYMVKTLANAGLIKKIDKERMAKTLEDVDDAFKGNDYDPDLSYCVPEGGGTVGIFVNRDKVDKEITSWNDLFDSSLKGKIVMLDDQRIILGIGNVLNGNEFNDTNVDHINAAKETMSKIIPNVKQFVSFDQYDTFLNGEADIMVGWSYEMFMTAEKADCKWEYIYPKEGMHIYMDNYCLCANTEKDELVYELIDYICGPDFNQIVWSENPGTRLAGKACREAIEIKEEEKVIVYPEDEQYKKGLYLTALPDDAMVAYDTAWTQFKQQASVQ